MPIQLGSCLETHIDPVPVLGTELLPLFPWEDRRAQWFVPVHESWLTATQRDQKLVCLLPHTGLLLLKSFLQLFLMANEMES